MGTTTRQIDWRSMVVQADPEFNRDSVEAIEYEFTAKGRGRPETHHEGHRVFRGRYKDRGPYGG